MSTDKDTAHTIADRADPTDVVAMSRRVVPTPALGKRVRAFIWHNRMHLVLMLAFIPLILQPQIRGMWAEGTEHQWRHFLSAGTLSGIALLLFFGAYIIAWPFIRLGSLVWQALWRPPAAGMSFCHIRQDDVDGLIVRLSSVETWQLLGWHMLPLLVLPVALTPLAGGGTTPLGWCGFVAAVIAGTVAFALTSVTHLKSLAAGRFDLILDFSSCRVSLPDCEIADTKIALKFRVIALYDIERFWVDDRDGRPWPSLWLLLKNGESHEIISFGMYESVFDAARLQALADWLNGQLAERCKIQALIQAETQSLPQAKSTHPSGISSLTLVCFLNIFDAVRSFALNGPSLWVMAFVRLVFLMVFAGIACSFASTIYDLGAANNWHAFLCLEMLLLCGVILAAATVMAVLPAVQLVRRLLHRGAPPVAGGLAHWEIPSRQEQQRSERHDAGTSASTTASTTTEAIASPRPPASITVRLSGHAWWHPLCIAVVACLPSLIIFTPWFLPPPVWIVSALWLYVLMFFGAIIFAGAPFAGRHDLTLDFAAGLLRFPHSDNQSQPLLIPLKEIHRFDAERVFLGSGYHLVVILRNGIAVTGLRFNSFTNPMDATQIQALVEWLNETAARAGVGGPLVVSGDSLLPDMLARGDYIYTPLYQRFLQEREAIQQFRKEEAARLGHDVDWDTALLEWVTHHRDAWLKSRTAF